MDVMVSRSAGTIAVRRKLLSACIFRVAGYAGTAGADVFGGGRGGEPADGLAGRKQG